MLYEGEGAKRGETVDFTNTSPQAIQLFYKFLNEICRVQKNRLRFYLYCYSSQDPESLIKYWSELLEIPKFQFTKPYVTERAKGKRISEYGVLHIRYSDKRLLKEILTEISTISRQLLNG